MAKLKEHDLAQRSDSRVLATQQIWSCATGMLVICLVFGGSNRNTVIPPIVISTAAAISTAFVWKSGKKSRQELQPSQLEQIEERLANLETIAGAGRLEVGNKIKQLEISDLQITNSNSLQP